MASFEIQTRSEETGLARHKTLKEALLAGEKDLTIWKITFRLPTGENLRMTRACHHGNHWMLNLLDMEKIEQEAHATAT